MHRLDAESRELRLVVSRAPPELWYAEHSEYLTTIHSSQDEATSHEAIASYL